MENFLLFLFYFRIHEAEFFKEQSDTSFTNLIDGTISSCIPLVIRFGSFSENWSSDWQSIVII